MRESDSRWVARSGVALQATAAVSARASDPTYKPAARGREDSYCNVKCKQDVKSRNLDKMIAERKSANAMREAAREAAKTKTAAKSGDQGVLSALIRADMAVGDALKGHVGLSIGGCLGFCLSAALQDGQLWGAAGAMGVPAAEYG